MKRKKRPPNGFPEQIRMAVRRRSADRCEVGSVVCAGRGAHFHHRKLRSHRDHSEINCLFACQPCRTHIHANPSKSYLMGWLVHSWDDPAEIPVKRGSTAT